MRTGFKFSNTLLIIVLASACNEDKECVPPPLSEHIVGVWDAKLGSEDNDAQEVTFENDGRLKESKGLLFGTYYNPITTWEVKNDSLIVSGKYSNGTIERYECSIVSRNCDQILLDIDGIDKLELIKK